MMLVLILTLGSSAPLGAQEVRASDSLDSVCIRVPELLLEPLTQNEIDNLESARMLYYRRVKDSFPTFGTSWWSNSVYCWVLSKRDSLLAHGRDPAVWLYLMDSQGYFLSREAFKIIFSMYDYAEPSRRVKDSLGIILEALEDYLLDVNRQFTHKNWMQLSHKEHRFLIGKRKALEGEIDRIRTELSSKPALSLRDRRKLEKRLDAIDETLCSLGLW